MADIFIDVEHHGRTRWRSSQPQLKCELLLPSTAQQQTKLLALLASMAEAQPLLQCCWLT